MADEHPILDEARAGMAKSFESLQRDMSRIRTGRASPALLDGVTVDYYGTPTPLKQLSTVNTPEARLITVQPFDPSSVADIERAILKADLGLTPINDGKLLRVPIPELTEERRKELVKQVKKMGEEHKVGVRGARRDGIAHIKEQEKASDLAEDDSRHLQKRMQELTDEFVAKVDQAVSSKEQEILTV